MSACPGAGKTRCIIERARKVLSESFNGKGIAFLSFTNAAISELEERLQIEGLLPVPALPHFVGTFDSFIWKYLVEPFGIPESDQRLKLIADKGDFTVKPFPAAQEVKLSCFDRITGFVNLQDAPGLRRAPSVSPYEAAARTKRARLLEQGFVDFTDIREIAAANLTDPLFNQRLARILNARFSEIIVDEAQDCNPEDLNIIEWLRSTSGVPTKVVCDPHQSIYGFRDGVAEELFEYERSFLPEQRLPLSGNFRSSGNVCKVIHSLRSPTHRAGTPPDRALGPYSDNETHIYVLSYRGAVSNAIGSSFVDLARNCNVDYDQCRLVSKTRASALKAVGAYADNVGQSLSQRLAHAVMKFHFDDGARAKLEAIQETHQLLLQVGGYLQDRTYHQYLSDEGLDAMSWRGDVLKILKSLKFDTSRGDSRGEWIGRVHREFSPFLGSTEKSIAQLFRNEARIDTILSVVPISEIIPATIHEVKGLEYEGVCVVLTSSNTRRILDYLHDGTDDEIAEASRTFYVAASRAEKLLAIACPQSQASRLVAHISQFGATATQVDI